MRFVFMDNYRGFSETFIRLANATFLVGENSTGKSSFLELMRLFSSPDFVFGLEFPAGGDSDLGGFSDIVSVGSADRSYFAVGILLTELRSRRTKTPSNEMQFAIMVFRDKDGLPEIKSYTSYYNSRVATLRRKGKNVEYRISEDEPLISRGSAEAQSFFLSHYRNTNTYNDYKPIPKGMREHLLQGTIPITLALSMLCASPKGANDSPDRVSIEFPENIAIPLQRTTWIAPIRTRPKRIYEGIRTHFTPEGDHTPFVIKQVLGSSKSAGKFTELVKKFGEASGLFQMVSAHSFGSGKNPVAPFELVISLRGKELNIGNVGYGVSQVLPVVVEIILGSRGTTFAIQQPEVHLHPRAQAALGDLIHFLVVNESHTYIIETHSDYLIDRFRLRVKEQGVPKDAQVVFFSKTETGNRADALMINEKGQYPEDQPDEFRSFFINEEISLLEI